MDGTQSRGRTVGQDYLEGNDVISGDAVLEAVGTAGIFGHVSADGTGRLTRWIGHVVETIGEHGLGQAGVHHSGLQHRPPLRGIDAQDPIEPGEGDEHRVGVGQGSPRQTGPRPPGDEGHP
jgi:hypothetical protein